jgi:hypothetical protein
MACIANRFIFYDVTIFALHGYQNANLTANRRRSMIANYRVLIIFGFVLACFTPLAAQDSG